MPVDAPRHRGKHRPALFLFDGQNVFGHEGSFAGGWHAHEAVDALNRRRAGLAPVVVAIDHGNAQRVRELSPWGQLDELVAFVTSTVMPEVHRRHAIQEGPEGHVVGGSSMGGLAALAAHFRRPDVFAGALAMSPSLWFHGEAIFELVRQAPNPYRSRVYLDCGGREAGGRMLAAARRMADELRARGWHETEPRRGDLGMWMKWQPDARGTHDERAWARRLPKALRFLFG